MPYVVYWCMPPKNFAVHVVFYIAGPASSHPPSQPSAPPSVLDDVDRRDLEDYCIDPDGPDSDLDGEDIDHSLSALFKNLQGVSAEDLNEMLSDIPLPETGEVHGISVQEAVEVRIICYIACHITCHITYNICSWDCCHS